MKYSVYLYTPKRVYEENVGVRLRFKTEKDARESFDIASKQYYCQMEINSCIVQHNYDNKFWEMRNRYYSKERVG